MSDKKDYTGMERENNYKDPDQVNVLMEQFNNLTSAEEIKVFLDKVFPGWLVGSTDKYCKDYPHFTHNWNVICAQLGAKPQRIITVDFVPMPSHMNNHKLLTHICNVMTGRGYIIRRKEEFIGCEKCGAAIPIRKLWLLLKNNNAIIPDVWSEKCTKCDIENRKTA